MNNDLVGHPPETAGDQKGKGVVGNESVGGCQSVRLETAEETENTRHIEALSTNRTEDSDKRV